MSDHLVSGISKTLGGILTLNYIGTAMVEYENKLLDWESEQQFVTEV